MTKKEEILAVIDYRRSRGIHGDYFVGSLAMAKVCLLLNVPHLSLKEKIIKASKKEIGEVWAYLKSYIEYMQKYPIVKCPCCGSAVDANKIKP